MLNMSESEWDLIFQVHCKGSFAPAHFAGNYWKNKSKETGQPQDGRIIVTSSIVGLNGAALQETDPLFPPALRSDTPRFREQATTASRTTPRPRRPTRCLA